MVAVADADLSRVVQQGQRGLGLRLWRRDVATLVEQCPLIVEAVAQVSDPTALALDDSLMAGDDGLLRGLGSDLTLLQSVRKVDPASDA